MENAFSALLLVALGALTSCKAFDPTLLDAGNLTALTKLPAMESTVISEPQLVVTRYTTTVAPGAQDLATYFEREVRTNLTEPYAAKMGYLELKVVQTRMRPGAWCYVSAAPEFCTAGVSYLLGLPAASYKLSVTTELDVLDKNRRLLASYQADGEAKNVNGLYSTTNYADPHRTLTLLAVRDCVDKIKVKMLPDMARLRGELQQQ